MIWLGSLLGVECKLLRHLLLAYDFEIGGTLGIGLAPCAVVLLDEVSCCLYVVVKRFVGNVFQRNRKPIVLLFPKEEHVVDNLSFKVGYEYSAA